MLLNLRLASCVFSALSVVFLCSNASAADASFDQKDEAPVAVESTETNDKQSETVEPFSHLHNEKSVLLVHEGESAPPRLLHFLSSSQRINPLGAVQSRKSWDQDAHVIDVHGNGNLFSSLVLYARSLPKHLSIDEIVTFVVRGGNLLWILPSSFEESTSSTSSQDPIINVRSFQLSKNVINLASHFGRHLPQRVSADQSSISDQFGSSSSSSVFSPIIPLAVQLEGGLHGTFSAGLDSKSEPYVGFSHQLIKGNPLTFSLLTAPESSTSNWCASSISGSNSDEQEMEQINSNECSTLFGSDNVVGSALQSRSASDVVGGSLQRNARVTILTAIPVDQSSDKPYDQDFSSVIAWTLQESGQLALDSFEVLTAHSNKQNQWQTPSDSDHRVGDRLYLRACVSTSNADIAQSLATNTQLHPIVDMKALFLWKRIPLQLQQVNDNQLCFINDPEEAIILPMERRIFTASLSITKSGWSHVAQEKRIPVRPLTNVEKMRHMQGALPYYVSWISQLAVATLFLYPLLTLQSKQH